MQNILIVGATSAIAEATARRYALRGSKLFLLARNSERLSTMAADLKIRGAAEVYTAVFDANDFASHQSTLSAVNDALGHIDIVLIAHGTLSDQKACEASVASTLHELTTNAMSAIALLTLLANQMELKRHGSIAVISSVAGDRGRQSNYVYGTAKSAVSTFLQGLRNRLYKSNVHVVTIKPGFVNTPMTAAFPKGPLWASAETIAIGIEKAIDKKKDVVYLPGFWWLILMLIRLVPERFFKRLSL